MKMCVSSQHIDMIYKSQEHCKLSIWIGLLILQTSLSVFAKCPADTEMIQMREDATGNCFALVMENLNYTAARAECQSRGSIGWRGSLALINTQEAKEAVSSFSQEDGLHEHNQLSSSTHMWIEMHQTADDWHWMRDGSTIKLDQHIGNARQKRQTAKKTYSQCYRRGGRTFRQAGRFFLPKVDSPGNDPKQMCSVKCMKARQPYASLKFFKGSSLVFCRCGSDIRDFRDELTGECDYNCFKHDKGSAPLDSCTSSIDLINIKGWRENKSVAQLYGQVQTTVTAESQCFKQGGRTFEFAGWMRLQTAGSKADPVHKCVLACVDKGDATYASLQFYKMRHFLACRCGSDARDFQAKTTGCDYNCANKHRRDGSPAPMVCSTAIDLINIQGHHHNSSNTKQVGEYATQSIKREKRGAVQPDDGRLWIVSQPKSDKLVSGQQCAAVVMYSGLHMQPEMCDDRGRFFFICQYDQRESACVYSDRIYLPKTRTCLMFNHKETVTWHDARLSCFLDGGDLVTWTVELRREVLTYLALYPRAKEPQYWVGAMSLTQKCNGIQYENFSSCEPNSYSSECLGLVIRSQPAYQMGMAKCADKNMYICELREIIHQDYPPANHPVSVATRAMQVTRLISTEATKGIYFTTSTELIIQCCLLLLAILILIPLTIVMCHHQKSKTICFGSNICNDGPGLGLSKRRI